MRSNWGYHAYLIIFHFFSFLLMTFCGSSDSKESACNAGDLGSIPGSGRSSGEGNGNPLQYSCLENPMDRGAWRATVHEVTKSWTLLKRLSTQCNDYFWLFTKFCKAIILQWKKKKKKNTGVGCHSLLQRIFLTQELNPGLLRCRQILYWLSYKRSSHQVVNKINQVF